jgi:Glycosyltransferase like family
MEFSPPPLVLVCASKVSARLFARATLLGRSLQSIPEKLRPGLMLLADNIGPGISGLPEFYNQAIERLDSGVIVAFVHDDVYLHDWSLGFHLDQALELFDLVGVVGSSKVPYGQPGWWHALDQEGRPHRNDSVLRSGSINHFDPALVRPDWYGPAPMPCDLLDGVFLAARIDRLREYSVRFDPQFQFHCYDADFCYAARSRGFRLGTWPIPLTHGSPGGFDAAWVMAARQLQKKLVSEKP